MVELIAARDYCGIIFIGGGSSWAWGSSPEDCAKAAAKQCRKDWGKYFDIPAGKIKVNVYDMRSSEGWEADDRGVVDSTTGEKLTRVALIEA